MDEHRVLILTPNSGFGELIRQVLEEAGAYHCEIAGNPVQAMRHMQSSPASLLVLDAELDAGNLIGLIKDLRARAAHTHLILIPKKEDPDDTKLAALGASHVLPSPFYLPDLITAVEDLFGPSPRKAQKSSFGEQPYRARFRRPERKNEARPPDWLGNVSLAAQYLTPLSLESASQAALITRRDQVWAYAGELPQNAAQELASAVSRYWDKNQKSDLARFVHLQSTQMDYMLYATDLGGEFALALVFDTEISFSKMRAQAGELARALAAVPAEAMAELRGNESESPTRRDWSERDYPLAGTDAEHQEAKAFQPQLPRADLPSPAESKKSLPSPAPIQPDGNLLFTYVLIPRLPHHHLEGDLAEKLVKWLPLLCVAYGWRLENVNIQARFLQWTVSISPQTSPKSVVELLEQQLSQRIFETFTPLARENPSGEFWARGALILAGSRPSAEEINAYIQQTRARQGLPRSV